MSLNIELHNSYATYQAYYTTNADVLILDIRWNPIIISYEISSLMVPFFSFFFFERERDFTAESL
jgi:hypothetical protein